MRAATIERFKTPAVVHDIDTPAVEDNAVLLRVTAAGVNPVDWKIRDGEGGERTFSLVLGGDFAGVIERVGKDVTRFKQGDRVFGTAREHGAFAEYTEVKDGEHDSPFTFIPDGISDALAASIPIPILTALASLEALKVGRGTDLLVVGAAGSVGSAAVQMARHRGAVITAFVKPGQETDAERSGATTVVSSALHPQPAISERHPGTFDAVLDLVSDGEQLKTLLPLMKRGALLVTTIHVADEAWFAAHGVTAINIVMAQTAQSSPQALDQIAKMVLDGKLVVSVGSERPLDDANAVLDALKAGTISGKVILRP